MLTVACTQCGLIGPLSQEQCRGCGAVLSSATASNENFHTRAEGDISQSIVKTLPAIGPFTGVSAVLGPTITLFTKNLWLITKLVFAIFAPFEIFRAMSVAPDEGRWQVLLGAGFLGLVCKALIAPSLIYALVTVMHTGVAPTLNESYRWGLSRLGKLCTAAAMAWTLQAIGYVFLIIPGIILSLAFELVYPMAALEKHGPVEILKRSYNLTKGYRWNILFAGIVIGLLCGAVNIPVTVASAVLLSSDTRVWPLEAALAMVTDIANEMTTVLSLVIYLSIVQFAEPRETQVDIEES